MKSIPPLLFQELKSQTPRIAVGWLLVRVDGQRFGFTTSDIQFTYNGDAYTPANGWSPSALVSKADASVDNLEAQVLMSETITESDLRGGVWANAQVQVFWICPYHPEWGIIPLRGGKLGEIVLKAGQFTTQLRALFQQLQLPFGWTYNINCTAQLGDARCKVKINPPAWQPNTVYSMGMVTDAGIGSVVKPTVDNGFWYVANYRASTDPAKGHASAPGQGLSAMDDLGPEDDTQKAVGPANNSISNFIYQGNQDVDIFGIKI